MTRSLPHRYRRQGAFTLIQMLVVLGIIGILIGAMVLANRSAKVKAYNVQAMMCAEQIRKAQNVYNTDNQRFGKYADLDAGMLSRCNLVEVTPVTETARGYEYTVKHTLGDATYSPTEADDSVNQQGTAVAGSSGGVGSGAASGPPSPPADPNPPVALSPDQQACVDNGGVAYSATYGMAGYPDCEVPADCPSFPDITADTGETLQAHFMPNVGCTYASFIPKLTFRMGYGVTGGNIYTYQGSSNGNPGTTVTPGPVSYDLALLPSARYNDFRGVLHGISGCGLDIDASTLPAGFTASLSPTGTPDEYSVSVRMLEGKLLTPGAFDGSLDILQNCPT